MEQAGGTQLTEAVGEVPVDSVTSSAREGAAGPVGTEASTNDADPVPDRAGPPRDWVCDGAIHLDDHVGGTWSLGRISFVNTVGYERVVMHLQRAGSSGAGASATAEAFPTSAIRQFAPMASRPAFGGVTIGVDLEDGVRAGLGLRRYRPRGMRSVRELSVYRLGGRSTKVLVSVASDGCFRLRASGWRGPADARSARINLDVRP